MINDVKMESSILLKEQIVKATNNIRKKFNMIKHGNEDMEKLLDKTFDPIVSPLKALVNKENSLVSTSKTNNIVNETVNQVDPGHEPESIDLYTTCKMYLENLLPTSHHYALMDVTYGVRITTNNELAIGNSLINFAKNGDFKVKNENYKGSLGLYELIFLKKPETYTTENTNEYKKLIIETASFRKNYDALGSINGNKSFKYRNIISKLIGSKSGDGLIPTRKKLTSLKSEYVYWDDCNELIDRLRLLFSSRSAGHTGHDNEILSIIEELKESNIIE